MACKGYYSIIRYVPDSLRGECVNLGVMLSCPEQGWLDWRRTTDHRRAKRFFQDEVDLGRLAVVEKGLYSRLEKEREHLVELTRLRDFVTRHRDLLQMTPLRTCSVGDPESDLEQLYQSVVAQVDSTARREHRMTTPQVRRKFLDCLKRANLIGKLRQSISVKGKYRTWKPYTFDYGYQNGTLNVIHSKSFDLADRDEALDGAWVLLKHIEDVQQHSDPSPRFSVVCAFAANHRELEEPLTEAFREQRVDMVPVDRMDSLIARVRQDLGLIQ